MCFDDSVLRDLTVDLLGPVDNNYRADDLVVRGRTRMADGSALLKVEVSLKPDMPTSDRDLQPCTFTLVNVPYGASDYSLYRRMIAYALKYPAGIPGQL